MASKSEEGFLAESPKPWIGRRLGVYELIEEIGSGGMGKVYLAFRADDAYRKRVAIKISRASIDGTEMIERFRQERQILASLQHPNIVRLLDGGTTEEGLPYLVMDYIEGERIDRYCASRSLPIAKRVELFRTLCSAVQFAHQNLIIHRDIKPNNILVSADGVPHLFDFGVAKLLVADAVIPQTRAGLQLITLDYASPEQVLGERITTATDVYSLGIVLYELLTGRRPYAVAQRPDNEAVRIICEEEPAKPSTSAQRTQDASLVGTEPLSQGIAGAGQINWRQLTGDLDTIVLKALRKDPERRYGTAEQLSEDLRRYLEGLPVLARRDSLRYRAGKFLKRHTAGAVAVGLLGLSLIGGMIATGWQARIAQRQRREADALRVKAERRFNDVRRLASSFLFEFHDAIATLPGSTPARRLVVSKALEYLDGLAGEAEGDSDLQEELAAAYDRVGDVQGGITANLGDVKGAVASYGKAHQIRQALVSKQPDNYSFRRGLAYSLRKLGDGAFTDGRLAEAIADCRQSIAMTEALIGLHPDRAELQRDLAETIGRLCNFLLPSGDTQGAVDSCRRYGELVTPVLERSPDDLKLRIAVANNMTLLGNALRLSGKLDEAKESFRTGEKEYKSILERDPTNAGVQRSLAMLNAVKANTQTSLGEPEGAVASFEVALRLMRGLNAADPKNVRYRTDMTYMLLRRVALLLKTGRRSEAVASAKEGLAMLKENAERPEATAQDFNEYAWGLATCDVPELRDPARALQYASRAVESSPNPNALYLDTLAWAHFRSGNPAKAVEAAERAIAMMPASAKAGPAVGLRGQLEHDLAEFKKGPATK